MSRDNTGYTETLRHTGSGYVSPPYFQVAGEKIYASTQDNNQIWTGEMDIDHTNWTDTQRPGPSGTKHRIELHVVKDKIYYVYQNQAGGIWQVWTARMNTDGTGWTTTQRTNYTTMYQGKLTEGHVHFRVAGNKAYYCWSYPDDGGTWQIWTAEMDLDGTNWQATQRTTGSPSKWRPELQIVGDKIYYMWWEGSSSWSSQNIVTGEMGSNIINKQASYGLGINEDSRVSAFVNDDWMDPLYNGETESSVGWSVFSSISTDWTHVAITYDKSTLKLYINGELVSQGPLDESMRANAFDLMIGDDFQGTMDEVRICNVALSASQIRDTYRLATGTYYWKVVADDGAKTLVESPTRSFNVIGPDVPILISPADQATVNTDTPEFNWTGTAGDNGVYTLQYALDSLFTQSLVTNSGLTDTNFTPSSLADNTYFWHVEAVDSAAIHSGYQAHPFMLTVLTGGGAPQITLVSPPEDSSTLDHSMELEITVSDPESNPMTVWIYGDTLDASDLLYLEKNVASKAIITYDWTAPVLGVETGTVGLWHFDEDSGSTAYDETPDNHDGTITGATWTTGRFGAALDFDGDGDHVHVSSTDALKIAGPLTVETWVNPRSFNPGASGYNVISRKGDDASQNFIIRAHDSAPSFQIQTESGSYEAIGDSTDWSTGSWYYIVGVWDGSFTRLYLNGVQLDSTSGAGTPNTDDVLLSIGDKPAGGAEWDGLIDEFRYTNEALTSAQIASNYQLEIARYSWKVRATDGINDTTTSIAHFDITAPAPDTLPPEITLNYPPTDSSTTNPYMQLSATVDDNEADTVTVWIYGDTVSPPANAIYEEEVPLSSPTDVTLNWGETEFELRPSTVGLWHFNEGSGTTVADASPYGNDGTITGATWATGKFNQGLDFDGDDDYVEVASSDELKLTGDFTVEAWVKADNWPSTVMVFLRKGATSPATMNYLLRKDDQNRPCFQVFSTTTNENYALGDPSDWGPDEWYYLAGVWEGTRIKIYVNGVLVGDSTASGTPLTDDNVLHIGDNTIGTAEWQGLIDEVRISNKAMTSSEIAARYALGDGRYYWSVRASDGVNEDTSEIRYFDVGLPVNDPPEITLLSPPEDSSTTNSFMDLSAEVDDPEGDPMTVWVYGDTIDASDLLYVETDVPDPDTINHSWTAPVLSVETGTAGLWHFDEGSGSTTYDETANNHDGTITAATWSTEGRFGYALDFDGDNDYVEIASSDSLKIAGDMTIEAWVKADEWPSGVMVIARKGSPDMNYLLRKDDQNRPCFQVHSTTTASNFALGDPSDWGPDVWYYLAGVWEDTLIKIYVNGVLVGDSACSGTPLTDDNVLHIGDNTLGSAEWRGLIDEFRISRRALSAEEIEANYQLDAGTYYWKVAADDGVTKTLSVSETRSFTVEPEVNDPPEITLLSPPQDSTTTGPHMELSALVDDPESDPMTVYFYGDQNPDPITLIYQESDVSAPSTLIYSWLGEAHEFEVEGTKATTVGLWHFNENSGGTAYDETANNHDGTITGATWTTGKFGAALDFDGTGEHVHVSSTDALKIAGPLTVEAWVNPRSYNPGVSGYNVIARKGADDATNFILRAHDSAPSFEVHTDLDTSYEAVGISSDWSPGSWYYIAGVWDGSYARLYVDGVQIDSAAGAGTPLTDDVVLSIGDKPAGGAEWDGLIDEMRYTNGALTSAQIENTYRLEVGTYYWKVAADDGAKTLTFSETRRFFVESGVGQVSFIPSFQVDELNDVDTLWIHFDSNLVDVEAATFKITYDENHITPNAVIDGPDLPASNLVDYTIYPQDSILIYIGILEGDFDGPGSLVGIVLSADAQVDTTRLDFERSTLRDPENQNIPHTTQGAGIQIIVTDVTPPTVEVTAPASGDTLNYLPTLTIDFYDSVGLDRGYYQIDGCTGDWTELWSYNSDTSDTSIEWTVPSVSEGTHDIYFKVNDDVGNVNQDTCTYFWSFTHDITPPDPPTGLTAEPGHEKCKLSWTNPAGDDFRGVMIRRSPWEVDAYPEYDDDYPTPIGYPADQTEGDLAYQGPEESYRDSNNTTAMPRNVYYYSIFSYDRAGNYSTLGVGDTARATNYWLGDVTGNGEVYFEDLMILSNTFWTSDGDPNYDPEFDIGPTHSMSPKGIPTTDDVIDFEDLVIFAINFAAVSPNLKVAPLFADQEVSGPLALSLVMPTTELEVGKEFKVQVLLRNNPGTVKSMHLVLPYDPSQLEFVRVNRSEGLKGAPCPVFFDGRDIEHNVDVSLALLGGKTSIGGSGEIASIVFRLLEKRDLSFSFSLIDLRDGENHKLLADQEEAEYEVVSQLPSAYELSQNYPNPYNPQTQIAYQLPQAGMVSLRIYNIRGELVRTLVAEYEPAGHHTVLWDGRNQDGMEVSSGIYLYRMVAGDFSTTKKMVMIK